MKRRRFMQSTVVAGLATSSWLSTLAAGSELERTPTDYEGPYYPVGDRHRTGNLVAGRPRDQVLYFRGSVVDSWAQPVAGALVDVWQADPLGRYDHPRDPSPGERWDEFLYWGETLTDASGAFEFRTYLPSAYGTRPSHIHYKIWRDRERLLTSQLYFRQTGGTQGKSLHGDKADLQVVDLETADEELACRLRIVV